MWKAIFPIFGILFLSIAIVAAQVDECPEIVTEALSIVGDNCSELDRNSACYGAEMVESDTILQPRPSDFFLNPADRAELVQLSEVRPLTLDAENRSFGVAALSVQAEVPNSLPGQAVVFLLMGGATLTNEGAPNTSGKTPFQSFYFLPGIGTSPCYEAEPTLTIQTPESMTVNITLNGIDIQMSPNTLLTITDKVCTIHRGVTVTGAGTPDRAILLVENESVDLTIAEDGTITPIGIRQISEREFERGELIQGALNSVAVANGWSEQIVVRPAAFGTEPERPETGNSGDPCDTQYTVKSGDTLHAIAEEYQASVLEIVEANELANPRVIRAGQVLCIPNAGSGFVPLPSGR
jgi:hypothetical protein